MIHRAMARRVIVLEEVLRFADVDGVMQWDQFERITGQRREASRRWVLRVSKWLAGLGVRFGCAPDLACGTHVEFDRRALLAYVEPRWAASVAVVATWELDRAKAKRRALRRKRKASRRLSVA